MSEPGSLQSNGTERGQTALGRGRRRRSRAVVTVAVAVVTTIAVAGCGDPEDASLCTAYAEFLDKRAEVAALDPTAETAAAATDVAERYLAGVNRLQHAADGRYVQQLETLEDAIEDILRTLAAIPADADYATWAPLIDDDFEAAADAAHQVERLIAASCEVDVSAGAARSSTSGT